MDMQEIKADFYYGYEVSIRWSWRRCGGYQQRKAAAHVSLVRQLEKICESSLYQYIQCYMITAHDTYKVPPFILFPPSIDCMENLKSNCLSDDPSFILVCNH